MQPFLAMIMPVGSGLGTWGGVAPPYVDIGLPGQQPGVSHPIAPGGQPPYPSQGPGFPTHPIAPGGRPPGIWGGAPPYVDIGFPGQQPGVSHPIAPGGRPPGIWGGAPPYVDIGGPGPQPTPTPPIFLPPGTIPGLKPEHPIYIPPSSGIPGVPTHPIVLPPPGSPPDQKPEVAENWDVKTAWSAQTGWVVAIVPSEQHPGVPTPSS